MHSLYTLTLRLCGQQEEAWGRRGREEDAFNEMESRLSYELSISLWSQETDVKEAGSPHGLHSLLLQCLPCQPS